MMILLLFLQKQNLGNVMLGGLVCGPKPRIKRVQKLALSGQMPLFTTIVTRHFCAGQQRVKRAPHLGRLSGIIGR
jgi:hypothetical protein